MNHNEPTISKIKRGQSAEWCPRCKLLVMPVGLGSNTTDASRIKWGCPTCSTPTLEKPPS